MALPAPWLQLLGGRARTDRGASDLLTSKDEIYRLVAENATDVVWVMDLSGRYMYFSPSVMRLTGYNIEEIVANPIRVMTEAGVQYAAKAIGEKIHRDKTGQKRHLQAYGTGVGKERRLQGLDRDYLEPSSG